MNNDPSCSKGECKKPGLKCLLPVLAVFVVIFVFEWLFHGMYMMPQYEATTSVWRPMAEMENLMWVGFITKLLTAFAATCLYCMLSKNSPCMGKCYKTGAKFGFKIGLIVGAHDFASYIWLPVPVGIPASWFVGDVIMWVLVGMALAQMCRMCGSKGECKTA